MPIRDMTSRISPGMRVVRTQTVPQSEIQRGQQTAAENIEAQEQYSAYEERARAAEDVINEYNDEAEELQRLADEYESETDSARRQVLSEEIRNRIRSVNSTGERLNEEIDRYNSAYDTALAAGVITGGGKYSSGVERVSDPFVMSDGGVLVEVGGAGPEVAYLTPTGDADAARKRAETILNTPLPPLATPVERIDSAIRSVLPTIEQSEIESRFNVIEGVDSNPLRRAYNEFRESPTEYAATTVISAATGGALGAGMKVLPKVASKIPGVERLGVLARPVADKQIQRVETAVSARVSPAAGETVGNVARSLTTPAMLPLNVAGGAYALDVGQRVTAPTERGENPTIEDIGSRLATIVTTEILPGGIGGFAGYTGATRLGDYLATRGKTYVPFSDIAVPGIPLSRTAQDITEESIKQSFRENTFRPKPASFAQTDEYPTIPLSAKLPNTPENTITTWHGTDRRDVFSGNEVIVSSGSSELPGMYVAPVGLSYFSRVSPPPKLSLVSSRIPKAGDPALVYTTVRDIDVIPTDIRMDPKLRSDFIQNNVVPNTIYAPLIKREYEAVIPPNTRLVRLDSKYYTVKDNRKIPIYEFNADGFAVDPAAPTVQYRTLQNRDRDYSGIYGGDSIGLINPYSSFVGYIGSLISSSYNKSDTNSKRLYLDSSGYNDQMSVLSFEIPSFRTNNRNSQRYSLNPKESIRIRESELPLRVENGYQQQEEIPFYSNREKSMDIIQGIPDEWLFSSSKNRKKSRFVERFKLW